MCLQKRTWTNEMCPLVTTFPRRHAARLINALAAFSVLRRSLRAPRVPLTSSIKGKYFYQFTDPCFGSLRCRRSTPNSKQQHDTQQIPDYQNITKQPKNGLTKRLVAVTLLCVRKHGANIRRDMTANRVNRQTPSDTSVQTDKMLTADVQR